MAHKKEWVVLVMVENPIVNVSELKFGGEYVKAGNIIVRQRGTKHYPVKMSALVVIIPYLLLKMA